MMRPMQGIAVLSFERSHLLKAAATTLAIATVLAADAGLTQPALDPSSDQEFESLSDREQRLIAAVDQELSVNGPYSEDLIGLLTELSFHYEEIGAAVPAEETIRRILSVIRINNGLSSLEQVPLIRRLIGREAARGNVEATWELEQELVKLAVRNPDDVRSAGIFIEMGDKWMDILRRYDAGEFPEEIVLGCFYDDSLVHLQAARRGSRPLRTARSLDHTAGLEARNCGAGARSQARRSLVASAQQYYVQSAMLLRQNEEHAGDELRRVLTALVRTSYLFTNPGLGARSLRSLLDHYERTNPEAWLPQIETRVQIGDWDLLYASHLGTKYERSAAEAYEQAYDLLLEHGIAQDSIDAIFSPDMPIVLPSFVKNPLVSIETPRSRGYIDVAFIIARNGKSRQIEVLETTRDVPRSAERDLVRTIKFSRFRPRVTDGRFADSAPIVVRYHVND